MKLTMVRTVKASPDGIEVRTYEEGQTYDLPHELARIFLAEGWAVIPAEEEVGPSESKPYRPRRRKHDPGPSEGAE